MNTSDQLVAVGLGELAKSSERSVPLTDRERELLRASLSIWLGTTGSIKIQPLMTHHEIAELWERLA